MSKLHPITDPQLSVLGGALYAPAVLSYARETAESRQLHFPRGGGYGAFLCKYL